MKGSINAGQVKDGSASLMRALSGAPRCPLVGATNIEYDCDMIYSSSSQNLSIRPPFGGGFPNPPFGMPFGKWLLTITLSVSNPIAVTFRLGMGQNCGAQFETTINEGRFLVSNGSWDKLIIQVFHGNPLPAKVNSGWHIDPANSTIISNGSGPDLFTIANIDLSVSGNKIFKFILPEQNEFCAYQFGPFLYTDFFTAVSQQSLWNAGVSGFSQFDGWLIIGTPDGHGLPSGLYPNGTKLGTLKFQFSRFQETPLFSYTLSSTTAIFVNHSFTNPFLNPVYDWDFGDGSGHSNAVNPSHSYTTAQKFIVKLRLSDDSGTVTTFDQVVDLSIKANFGFSLRNVFNNGPVSEARFGDLSVGVIASWEWDFGDGTTHGTTPNPIHDYPRASTFNCTLTIRDAAGNASSVTKTINT